MPSDDYEKTTLSKERVSRYIAISKEARAKATPKDLDDKQEKNLESMMRMFDDYLSDAEHFLSEGDLIRAFGAVNYAHAWIDSAVRIGLMDGHDDDRLFTLPQDSRTLENKTKIPIYIDSSNESQGGPACNFDI